MSHAACRGCPHSIDQDAEHAAGPLRGPEDLYINITRGMVSNLGRILPADKGEVQDAQARIEGLEEYKAESEVYKNQTTTLINSLVGEVNSLTPVRNSFLARLHM